MPSIPAIIGGIICLVVGALLLFKVAFPKFKIAVQSTKWPSVEAEMINAERKKRQDEDGPTYYEVHVDVTYEVDGRSYSGKVVKSFGKKESRKVKRQINKEGGTTTIFYDPDDPSRYVQVRGVTPASFLIFLLPTVFFIAGGVFLGGRF